MTIILLPTVGKVDSATDCTSLVREMEIVIKPHVTCISSRDPGLMAGKASSCSVSYLKRVKPLAKPFSGGTRLQVCF